MLIASRPNAAPSHRKTDRARLLIRSATALAASVALLLSGGLVASGASTPPPQDPTPEALVQPESDVSVVTKRDPSKRVNVQEVENLPYGPDSMGAVAIGIAPSPSDISVSTDSVSALATTEYLDFLVTYPSEDSEVCLHMFSYDNFYRTCVSDASMTEFYVEVEPGEYQVVADAFNSSGQRTDTLWSHSSDDANRLRSLSWKFASTAGAEPANVIEFNFGVMPWLGDLLPSTPSIAASPTPLAVGSPVDLTASVTGTSGVPTGIVEIYSKLYEFVGDGFITDGDLTINYAPTNRYNHEFQVYYRGDTTYSSRSTNFLSLPLIEVTEVLPAFGPLEGGTAVTIVGTEFDGATGVTFDGVHGTDFTYVSDTELTVTTPAGTAGAVEIRVVTPTVPSGPNDYATFTYMDGFVEVGVPRRHLDLGTYQPGTVRCFPVGGWSGVPYGASGVILNVTAVNPSSGGYVVVYPDYAGTSSSPAPVASTVNFEPGKSVANTAFVELPANGEVCVYSAGGTMSRFLMDVSGYIVPGSGIELQEAERLLDTRTDLDVPGPVAPNATHTVQVTGAAGGVGVPEGASSVLVNVTVTGAQSGGHLRMWEADTTMPPTSVVNYVPAQTKANAQIVALSPSGELSFQSVTSTGVATNPVQVIIDVVGWVEGDSQFVPTNPTRLMETRNPPGIIGPVSGPLNANQVYALAIDDETLVPDTAIAVVLNVTAVNPTSGGHIRIFPDTAGGGLTTAPLASNINYIPGRAIPNMVVVQLPESRSIGIYSGQTGSNSTHLIVDIVGYIEVPVA